MNEKNLVCVLAGSQNEFLTWVAHRMIDEPSLKFDRFHLCLESDDTRHVYCSSRERLFGLRLSEILVVGTFWERDDAVLLMAEARMRIRK